MWRIWTFRILLAALAATLAPAVAAHPARGIVVAPDGRVYFSDLERIWSIGSDGRLSLVREHRGIHTHSLAISRAGDLYGEDSDYHPADQSYWESVWKISPKGRFSYVVRPRFRVSRGIGLMRDARGCSYHADQTGQHGRPLVHRQCPGKAVERLVGTAADDRGFRPVLVNDVAGVALGPDGSFYFRQGGSVRRLLPNGQLRLVASNLAAENFGLALNGEGQVYVVEFANRRLVLVGKSGGKSIIARSASPWGPTGVAVRAGAIYLLEATEYRRGVEMRMRVRKIVGGAAPRLLATVSIPLD